MTDDHHAHDASSVDVAILTISSSREVERDASGDAIATALEDAGHRIVARDLVVDDERAIRSRVDDFADRKAVDAIVTTGGTGVTPDDVTVEAVTPLFDRKLPGFGEQFRARSVDEVGPHGMLTRATAGTSGDVAIFCLPGSEDGARFGTTELIVPVIGHVVGLLSGGGHDHHDHGDSHDHHDHSDSHDHHDHSDSHDHHDHGGESQGHKDGDDHSHDHGGTHE
jgi:molybdenum cofactor biosynthesis protein B